MEYSTLQALCAAKGTNPTALVKKLGMSTGNLRNWKKSINPSVEVAQKMCAILGCTMDELLGTEKPAVLSREQPVNKAIVVLIEEIRDLTDEEAAKVREYAQLLKLKRKQKL